MAPPDPTVASGASPASGSEVASSSIPRARRPGRRRWLLWSAFAFVAIGAVGAGLALHRGAPESPYGVWLVTLADKQGRQLGDGRIDLIATPGTHDAGLDTSTGELHVTGGPLLDQYRPRDHPELTVITFSARHVDAIERLSADDAGVHATGGCRITWLADAYPGDAPFLLEIIYGDASTRTATLTELNTSFIPVVVTLRRE